MPEHLDSIDMLKSNSKSDVSRVVPSLMELSDQDLNLYHGADSRIQIHLISFGFTAHDGAV